VPSPGEPSSLRGSCAPVRRRILHRSGGLSPHRSDQEKKFRAFLANWGIPGLVNDPDLPSDEQSSLQVQALCAAPLGIRIRSRRPGRDRRSARVCAPGRPQPFGPARRRSTPKRACRALSFVLRPAGAGGRFDQGGPQPAVTLPGLSGFVLAGALVVPRTEGCPTRATSVSVQGTGGSRRHDWQVCGVRARPREAQESNRFE
jgi:hypothetical protein